MLNLTRIVKSFAGAVVLALTIIIPTSAGALGTTSAYCAYEPDSHLFSIGFLLTKLPPSTSQGREDLHILTTLAADLHQHETLAPNASLAGDYSTALRETNTEAIVLRAAIAHADTYRKTHRISDKNIYITDDRRVKSLDQGVELTLGIIRSMNYTLCPTTTGT
jgi:hypothetical protein